MTTQAQPPTPNQWRTFFADCAAHPLAAGARMRHAKTVAWKVRGQRCELCGVTLDRGTFAVVPVIPVALGGHAGFENGINACPACAEVCRHIDVLPVVETSPDKSRERLLERREGVLAKSRNESTPAGLNRAEREAVLAGRWAYPRTAVHIDAGAGLVGFQRAFTPDPLMGALCMVIRGAGGVLGQAVERRWVGLHIAPSDIGAVTGALVKRNGVFQRPHGP